MNKSGSDCHGVGCADPVVRLASHGWEVGIDPERGGRIIFATYKGLDILRPEGECRADSALESACFPLVPFSNRIRHGAFQLHGQRYQVEPNWDGDAHAIHGEGWQQAWDVIAADDARALLRLYGTGWWPWDYECLQEITVGARGIGLSLTLRNTDTRPMPAGLGLHPYFPCTQQTTLRFDAANAAPPMGDGPVIARQLDAATSFARARPVSQTRLDHCYAGWHGPATIHYPESGLQVTVTPLRGAQGCVLYTPDASYFCFEPVTQLTGAFEAPAPYADGLKLLAPGEEMTLAISLEASLQGDVR